MVQNQGLSFGACGCRMMRPTTRQFSYTSKSSRPHSPPRLLAAPMRVRVGAEFIQDSRVHRRIFDGYSTSRVCSARIDATESTVISDNLLITQCFRLFVELLLPGLLVIHAFPDKGSEHGKVQQQPVEEVGWKTQRLAEINEQDNTGVRCPIPGLVFVGVVKNDHFALAPAIKLIFHANAELLARLGNDESEMQSKNSVVRAPVRRQMFAGLED